jgi:stage V sporulation protein SpoVS
MSDEVKIVNAADPGLLLIKGKNGENKDYVKKLAHAILIVIGKFGYANLKCVGASAVNNAIKAVTIASGEAKKRGVNLVVSPSFQEANFGSGDSSVEKTAIVLNVFNR